MEWLKTLQQLQTTLHSKRARHQQQAGQFLSETTSFHEVGGEDAEETGESVYDVGGDDDASVYFEHQREVQTVGHGGLILALVPWLLEMQG